MGWLEATLVLVLAVHLSDVWSVTKDGDKNNWFCRVLPSAIRIAFCRKAIRTIIKKKTCLESLILIFERDSIVMNSLVNED